MRAPSSRAAGRSALRSSRRLSFHDQVAELRSGVKRLELGLAQHVGELRAGLQRRAQLGRVGGGGGAPPEGQVGDAHGGGDHDVGVGLRRLAGVDDLVAASRRR